VNDYKELQRIYEGYPGPHDPIKPGNYYPAKQDWGPYSRPVPGSPEASGYSQFRKNQVSSNTVQIIDEELPEKQISNLDVLGKIDELIQESIDEGKEYAVLQLSRLKEYISDLSH
jgi:hypothetical protein